MIEQGNIRVFEGDITALAVDAIVNAANSALAGGGGVDGAIHRAAGPQLKQAAVKLAPCPPGEARITPGFDLPARFVIHAVGPIWRGGSEGEAELLARAYSECYRLASANACRSIALPAISCGAYGFPIPAAVAIALAAARHAGPAFEDIAFPCFDARVLHAFERAMQAD